MARNLPASLLLGRSLLGLHRGGHFELPNSFAAAGETRGRGAGAQKHRGGWGGVRAEAVVPPAAGSEPRSLRRERTGSSTPGAVFCARREQSGGGGDGGEGGERVGLWLVFAVTLAFVMASPQGSSSGEGCRSSSERVW